FYECHTAKLYEHIIDIQNNKLSSYRKIFNSKNLKEVLQLPEEEPSLMQAEKKIAKNEKKQEELHIHKEIERKIEKNGEKLEELHILKEIEKTIKDLPVLKQDIKEQKESIEVMKTNK
ncbi:7752_t:CDS:1, partial [Gigaspora rosea]